MLDNAVEAAAVAHVSVRERALSFATRHWIFGVVLAVACLLRAAAVLAYQPVQWFNDSYSYVTAAVTHVPETIRPSGYALLLNLLQPLHRFAAVTLVQHVLGIATGVLVYAVLRVRGLRAWLAALAAVPVLFDAYEIQLEHLVMADTLFMFLITAAAAALCLQNQPGWKAAVVAGLLLGMSAVVRTDGRPLLIVAAVCLIIRRAGWRPVVAMVGVGLLPIAAYLGWFHAARGSYELTQGDGTFLYSRVMAFANCADFNPPARLRPLCDTRPPSARPPSADYVWGPNPLRSYAQDPWSPQASKLASDFAFLAIRSQPADYLWVTAKDAARTFGWTRSTTFPDPSTASRYQFAAANSPVPGWAPIANLNAYQRGDLTTRVTQPYASMLITYQRYVYLRGPLFGLILLTGAAFVVTGRRRGAPGLLPWWAAMTLIAVPPVAAGFTYRYVLAAVPCACMAAGLAGVSARVRREPPRPGQPAAVEPVSGAETPSGAEATSAGAGRQPEPNCAAGQQRQPAMPYEPAELGTTLRDSQVLGRRT